MSAPDPIQQSLYCVLGDPVSHSLSPLIHNYWMLEHRLTARYVAIRVPEGELGHALEKLQTRGCVGVNITLPHKPAALSLAESASEAAKSIGAANTLIRKTNGCWHAENTDAPGFRHGLGRAFRDADIDRDSFGKDAPSLILGAGGAAMAVAHVFGDDQQMTIFCNRTIENAERLRGIYSKAAGAGTENQSRVCGFDRLGAELETCSFVVNATSLGHVGKSIEWPEGRGRLVYDLSYGKAAETFLAPARAAGWITVDGLRMLVAQAGFSFKHWFGMRPDFDEALARCHTTLEIAQ